MTAVTGYRIYSDDTATSPFAKGNSNAIKMTVMDGASDLVQAAAASVFLLLSATL